MPCKPLVNFWIFGIYSRIIYENAWMSIQCESVGWRMRERAHAPLNKFPNSNYIIARLIYTDRTTIRNNNNNPQFNCISYTSFSTPKTPTAKSKKKINCNHCTVESKWWNSSTCNTIYSICTLYCTYKYLNCIKVLLYFSEHLKVLRSSKVFKNGKNWKNFQVNIEEKLV